MSSNITLAAFAVLLAAASINFAASAQSGRAYDTHTTVSRLAAKTAPDAHASQAASPNQPVRVFGAPVDPDFELQLSDFWPGECFQKENHAGPCRFWH